LLDRVGRGLFAALVRLVECIAECLSGFVGEMTDAKELEPDLSFVDRSARDLACTAEFGGELIPKSHAILRGGLHCRDYAAEVS
jgi:hypothetical protein